MSTPVLAALASLSSDDLLRFLTKQRWFAAKGAAPSGARVATAVVLPWGDGAFAACRVVVALAEGEQSYQLTIGASASVSAEIPEHGLIATVEAGAARLVLYDAAYDETFRRGLVEALRRGMTAGDPNARWMIEPISGNHASPIAPDRAWRAPGHSPLATAIGSAEQSNTSIIIDDAAILKLFRILKPGVHPDVEVTRFLTTHAHFENTPALLATIVFDENGEVTTAGMLQQYLPGSTDAWSYALDVGREYFAAPIDRDAPNRFVADAERLGAITRELHDALASDDADPAFAPEPAKPEDLDRWAHRTQQLIREALSLLERQLEEQPPTSRVSGRRSGRGRPREGTDGFPKERLAEAQALVRRRDHYLGLVDEIADVLGDDLGCRVRVHGDYHLGQVLRTRSNDFMIIDFEGEPSRPLAERREKTSPLRDVAGMLRSIAYAAAMLARSVGNAIDIRTRELRSARWERDVRSAYLAGYAAAGDGRTRILPGNAEHVRQLIALFEAEKVFYELAYELNNRPGWVEIPMRGISKLLVSS